MLSAKSVFLAFGLSLLAVRVVAGQGVPFPRPLVETVGNAEVIVVGSIDQFRPQDYVFVETANPRDRRTPEQRAASERAGREVLEISGGSAAGVYTVSVLRRIKGEVGEKLEVHLPTIWYLQYGRNKFEVPPGAHVLLHLKKSSPAEGGKWIPVDTNWPLVPLSAGREVVPLNPAVAGVDSIDVLMASMADDKLRPVIAVVLQKVADPRLVKGMLPYSQEPNLTVRSHVLYCLAVNQEVSVIPLLAETAARVERETQGRTGTVAPQALSQYKTPAAVPFLNPLLLDGTDFVRMHAMAALKPLADKSSIPFLMYALEHDDPQQSVSFDAYRALQRLIGPSIGVGTGIRSDFLLKRDAEVERMKKWWEAEQAKEKAASRPAGQMP